MSTIKALEEELQARKDDLDACTTMLGINSDDEDAKALIPELEANIAELEANLQAEKTKQQNAAQSQRSPPPPSSAPKFDMSKHPKFRKASPEPATTQETQVTFKVQDVVSAKWSGDKQFWPATIVSKTGSSADPVYTVSFKGYDITETKRSFEIRALRENKKRKADGSPAVTLPAAMAQQQSQSQQHQHQQQSVQTGSVISAAPDVDTSLMVKKKEPSMVSDGPTRLPPAPKKLKGSKALDKAKSSWNDWQKSGPKKGGMGSGTSKALGKESQFRTADLPNAKVGFTGSGKPMQKDQKRTKWSYGQQTADDD